MSRTSGGDRGCQDSNAAEANRRCRSRGDRTPVGVVGLARGTPQGSSAVTGAAGGSACRYPYCRHPHRGWSARPSSCGHSSVPRKLGSLVPRAACVAHRRRPNDETNTDGCPMIAIEGAQPIRPYEPPISIVWSRGEPCTDAAARCLQPRLRLETLPSSSMAIGVSTT